MRVSTTGAAASFSAGWRRELNYLPCTGSRPVHDWLMRSSKLSSRDRDPAETCRICLIAASLPGVCLRPNWFSDNFQRFWKSEVFTGNPRLPAAQRRTVRLTISIGRTASAKKQTPRPAISGKLTFSRNASARKCLIAIEATRSGHRRFTPSQKSASFEWWLWRISRSTPTQVTVHDWTAIFTI
jgi:hypothetical protein